MATSAQTDRKKLLVQLRNLQQAFHTSRMKGSSLLMDVDVTLPQLKVLLTLGRNEPLTMGGLSTEMGLTLSACTHLVDKLVRSGFVDRYNDQEDRRVVRCSVTEHARALIDKLHESMPFERPEFVERMTDDELRTVVEAMVIVERVLREMQEETGT